MKRLRTITAIEPQQKNPRRVNIYLDGEFAFGLAGILATWLKVGQEITEEKASALQEEDARETIYQKALHFLGYRPRSSEEVRLNLIKRGFDKALIEKTIKCLQQDGLVNDEEFARAWVENRNTFRPRSKSMLRVELRRKGLDEKIIHSILDEIKDEQAPALEAARKQAHRYARLEWPEFRQKLGGFLARRGFTYSTLAPIVSEVWKELQTADAGRKTEIEEQYD